MKKNKAAAAHRTVERYKQHLLDSLQGASRVKENRLAIAEELYDMVVLGDAVTAKDPQAVRKALYIYRPFVDALSKS